MYLSKIKAICYQKRILSTDPGLLITVYKIYVLPLLTYCSPIWNPYTSKNILKIEKIQKRLIRYSPGHTDLSYHERLIKSN